MTETEQEGQDPGCVQCGHATEVAATNVGSIEGDDLASVAALDEPVRRQLYELVRSSAAPMSRDAAAVAAGLPRATAAFHLDKLVDAKLLVADFMRLSGRAGPGAGRPSKVYRSAGRQIQVSIPRREYELIGSLLAQTVEEVNADGDGAGSILGRKARQLGRTIGAEYTEQACAAGCDGHSGESATQDRQIGDCLSRYGYEPRWEGQEMRLRNCPFHSLSATHTELVCGMNVDLIGGVVEGLGTRGYRADLDPEDEYCCVRVRPTGQAGT